MESFRLRTLLGVITMCIHNLLALLVVLLVSGVARAAEVPVPIGPSLIGIDHVPTVVENLEEAVASYASLGFTLKPGRFHENGLENSHVKFKDGSGVELISPPSQPSDDLAAKYLTFLLDGEGPAYLSFHARNTAALLSALKNSGIPHEGDDGIITITERSLSFIFFVRDNRSPTDKPEHFAHRNSAVAMTEVWLALDASSRERLRELLLGLGAVESKAAAFVPSKVSAQVFTIQNGRIVVVPDTFQLVKGRPIFGAKFRVLSLQATKRFLGSSNDAAAPSLAHGLWLRFEKSP